MKLVKLANCPRFAMVDSKDFCRVNRFKWYLQPNGAVARCKRIGGASRTIYLHRFVVGHGGALVDHWDRNKLNNCRKNLRRCGKSENAQNMAKGESALFTSRFKGVSLIRDMKLKKPWRAGLQKHGRRIFIGYFATQRRAALAYNEAARLHFGQFALLNAIA